MGRAALSTKWMYFSKGAFAKSLNSAINQSSTVLAEEFKGYVIKRLAQINFKDNPVKLVGEGETSDAKRKQALLNSIRVMHGNNADDAYNRIKRITFEAMSKDYKNSFVGYYYEYGTGEKEIEMNRAERPLEEKNPARTSQTIVSRSKFDIYSGGPGKWEDIGGNLRVTGSPRAGVGANTPDPETGKVNKEAEKRFRAYIGRDINSYLWFHGSVDKTMKRVEPVVTKHLRQIKVFDTDGGIFGYQKVIQLGE